MQIPCVYIPGPAPAVSVANTKHKVLYPNLLNVCIFKILLELLHPS
jgi:hypothetical protein